MRQSLIIMTEHSVNKLVDHFFRNEFGKAVALLTSKFGTQYLEAAEDAVQEALTKAMQVWGYGQIPDNPTGWVIRVAQNKLIDHLRKLQRVYYATQLPETDYESPELPSDEQFKDEMIKMMFACCNPKLSTEYQIILTLKILGGLSIREISSALLKKEETIAKSYTRAKKRFKEINLKLEIPEAEEIQNRLDRILKIVYLLFNEGYKSTEGEQLIRKELCEEAMRLNQLLLDKLETNSQSCRALMALMHFQVARFDARVDRNGNSVSLETQDRSIWDQQHILLGNRYLTTIEDGMQNTYFIQAAINGIHCAAETYASTNWTYILMLYNHLYNLSGNPIVALNRIIPISKVHGAELGLLELEKIKDHECFKGNYLISATEAELLIQLKRTDQAVDKLALAIDLCKNIREKDFLRVKMNRICDNRRP